MLSSTNFYAASKPDVEHTWLICRPCHGSFPTGQIAWDEREAEFRAHQNRRRRMVSRRGSCDCHFRYGAARRAPPDSSKAPKDYALSSGDAPSSCLTASWDWPDASNA